jgi:16S rRNA G966 N2-methylase RsmD
MGALTENLEAAGFSTVSTTHLTTIERALKKLGAARATFQLVFADPPYALRETPGLVRAIDEAGLVAEGGRLVVEHDRREEVPDVVGLLAKVDERKFGDTMVTFYARRSRPPEGSAS